MANTYPKEIVPKEGFLKRMTVNNLLQAYPLLVVARRCDDKQPFALSADGTKKILKDDILGSNLLQMSVNLLGASFKHSHLSYSPDLTLVEGEWDGSTIPKLPLEDTKFKTHLEYGVVYFYVSKVNSFVYPYSKVIKEDEYRNIKEKANDIQRRENLKIDQDIVGAFAGLDNKQTQVHARLKVNHSPNLYNYWHMQMNTYAVASENPVDYSDKSGEAKRIRRNLREYIGRIAKDQTNSQYHIGHCHYMRKVPFYLSWWDYILDLFYDKVHLPFKQE